MSLVPRWESYVGITKVVTEFDPLLGEYITEGFTNTCPYGWLGEDHRGWAVTPFEALQNHLEREREAQREWESTLFYATRRLA